MCRRRRGGSSSRDSYVKKRKDCIKKILLNKKVTNPGKLFGEKKKLNKMKFSSVICNKLLSKISEFNRNSKVFYSLI